MSHSLVDACIMIIIHGEGDPWVAYRCSIFQHLNGIGMERESKVDQVILPYVQGQVLNLA